jgi:hypothetical protein
MALLATPFAVYAEYTYTFRLEVSGSDIYIQKRFGFERLHLQLSDISKVQWNTVAMNLRGQNDYLTTFCIFTNKAKRIVIDDLIMVGTKELRQYLIDSLSQDKFTIEYLEGGIKPGMQRLKKYFNHKNEDDNSKMYK